MSPSGTATIRRRAFERHSSGIIGKSVLKMDSADGRDYVAEQQTKPVHKYGMARHTMGIILLMCVVFLWTASNFLASNILADDSYSHPFFITYVNTSFFVVFLMYVIARRIFRMWRRGKLSQVKSLKSFFTYLDIHGMKEPPSYARETVTSLDEDPEDEEYGTYEADTQRQRLLNSYAQDPDLGPSSPTSSTDATATKSSAGKLGLGQTARLAAQFCMLWFLANYFAIACLQFTTVGSTTILTSTSGVWTLILGAMIGVEKFTLRKALGVFASLVGVILISRVDLSSSTPATPDDTTLPADGGNDKDPFSSKTPAEIALGDAMAALSAIVYGVYTIVMKKQVGDESRVNMQLFFGLVGFFNVFLLWPGFVILHFLDIERFSLPTENRIWVIILVNSISSLISDICWAYAMLLTTPLVVTVGLSLTIPLSLVGQIILQGQYAGVLYWIGATIVFASFMIVNQESKEDEEQQQEDLVDSILLSREGEREMENEN
ncbi:integral membrane protein, putative [Talaromyces stipitatus ATCC 10500]|uniref:Integral membrane protein, putative n=1 Tax=Talaromyces stipitatus (strain ATCC 10500 / CBS 375.48 / QM 6759 / NRRL 1006) TaxID=441959 RepID=B8LXF2_TALSN|nr:integral membrane protein, putative [Talaromyces stipitatus ATCC 10500]EED23234.1 integral membrane protein, putative [Talaromyces stipitatus ATCC 10500]